MLNLYPRSISSISDTDTIVISVRMDALGMDKYPGIIGFPLFNKDFCYFLELFW